MTRIVTLTLNPTIDASCESDDVLPTQKTRIILAGKAEMIAVSLGLEGAILVDRDGATFVRAAAVETRSAVGAGDSFLAAMIHGLSSGSEARPAFRMGVVAGAAAALKPGSDLAHPNEIEMLLGRLGADKPL